MDKFRKISTTLKKMDNMKELSREIKKKLDDLYGKFKEDEEMLLESFSKEEDKALYFKIKKCAIVIVVLIIAFTLSKIIVPAVVLLGIGTIVFKMK